MSAEEAMLAHHRNEAAARRPWLYAESESWWNVTGYVNERHTFTNCVAQVVPAHITGVDDGDGPALFKVWVYGGDPLLVDADKVTFARRLIFVMADDPAVAYYDDEQVFLRGTEATP